MSSESIRPSTLDGIKRLAKSIRNERGIQHIRALDVAAQSAGFQNFKHAQNVLKGGRTHQPQHPGHRLFLTAYWSDKESGAKGRETLTLWLETLWSELIGPRQLSNERTLGRFRSEGPDHLVERYRVGSQSQARRMICAAARTLQFMDATKLRPSQGHSRTLPHGTSKSSLPGRDHSSIWYDRNSKRYLLADEPYERAALSYADERAAWSERHGFTIAKPSWPGMYNPDGGSRLYLVADSKKGIPLEPVVAALDQIPEPIAEATWDGESAPAMPPFVSPGALTRTTARPTTPVAAKLGRLQPRSAMGYVRTFVGPQRRPNGKMPIEAHAKVGALLKSVLVASRERKGVYNRVNGIRCELDEWTQREYSQAELPNEQFFDLYYHESGGTFAPSLPADERSRHVENLANVKRTLAEHYPDSTPLRALLKNIDGAIKSMQSWH
jgi:hypothetical protein